VSLGFGTEESKAYEPLKVGEQVKVIGNFEVNNEAVYLRQCHVVATEK
jgi:hypothetical protein